MYRTSLSNRIGFLISEFKWWMFFVGIIIFFQGVWKYGRYLTSMVRLLLLLLVANFVVYLLDNPNVGMTMNQKAPVTQHLNVNAVNPVEEGRE